MLNFKRVDGLRTCAAFLICTLVTPAPGETLRNLTSVQIVGNVPFQTQLTSAKNLGVGGVRIAVRWSDVEKRKGRYNWHDADARAGAAIQAGFVPIVTLFGSSPFYGKLNTGTKRTSPMEADAIDGFAAFSAAVVKHFGTSASGHPIVYEIWNEPNTKTFWSVAPNPEAYATMAAAACRAIKQNNQAATVVGLAMEGTPVKQPYVVPAYDIDIYRQWADRAATPSLTACLDGLSMHPYRDLPETYLDDENAFQTFVRKHWLAASTPIVVNSEWGYQVSVSAVDGEQRQARQDLRLLLLGTAFGRRTNIYQIVDGGSNATKPDQTYGLFRYDGSIKPSGEAIARLMQLLGDYEVGDITTLQERSIYAVHLRRKAEPSFRAAIAWSTKDNAVLSISELFGGTVKASRMVDLVTGSEHAVTTPAISIGKTPMAVLVAP
jgi:hypothetical protein